MSYHWPMAYKDPERARRANAEKQRRHRERERLKRVSSAPETAAPLPAPAKRTTSKTPPPDKSPSVPMSTEEWTRRKVQLGQQLYEIGLQSLTGASEGKTGGLIGARDGLAILRAGVDFVNANLDNMTPGPVEDKSPDMEFMADPIFRDLMEQALIRKIELQLNKDGE